MIYWTEFTWEAFATLVTGLAAVFAAYWIGRKQLEIQELSLRSALFERRFAVYDHASQFLLYLLAEVKFPDDAKMREFVRAQGEAKFLFGQSVNSGLEEIWQKALKFRETLKRMETDINVTGEYDPVDIIEDHELLGWFSVRWRTLPDLFEIMKVHGKL